MSATATDARAATAEVIIRQPGEAERAPGKFARRRSFTDNLLRFGTPILILVLWQVTVKSGLMDRRFWPAPTDIFLAMVNAIRDGSLANAAGASISRILIGYVIGAGIGIVAGLVLGVFRPIRVALDPIISAIYTVPKLAVLPLLLLLFGLGDAPKIILISLGVFFVTVISTTAAVLAIPAGYLEPAQSFGATRMQTFSHVIAPAVLPEVFVALRLAAGQAVLLMIGIEFVQGNQGFGYLIWNSWQLYMADRMYVGIVAVAVMGVIFQTLVKWIGARLTPWKS
jgi:ABC-type nitrate/sulfonate/bicarbonate transport system permease component